MVGRPRLLFSAEHATCAVPPQLEAACASRRAQRLLQSHRGWDAGSLDIARFLAEYFRAPFVEAKVSRLVVDANRSPSHRSVFSELTDRLSPQQRLVLLQEYHAPHWSKVERLVQRLAQRGPVLHCAMHSFTPRWKGKIRNTEIGLLYDPRRGGERKVVLDLQARLRASTELTVHRNSPYRGISDGLPTRLRQKFPASNYWGLEIEINQKLIPRDLQHVKVALAEAIGAALNS